MNGTSNLDEPTFSFQEEPTYINNLQKNLSDEEILQLLALRQLNYTLQTNANSPLQIKSISFKGIKNTKKSTLEEIFKPAFGAKTLEECLTSITNSCGKLEALDMAKSFDINFKPSKLSNSGLDLELEVKEVPKFTVKTGTEFGEGESSLDSSLAIRNILGRGGKLEGSAKFGTLTRHNYRLNYFNPLDLHRPDRLLHLFAFDSTTDYQLNAAHDLISRGIGASLKASSALGHHEISVGSTWRTVTRMGFHSPPEIRKEAGDSILTSIKHTHTIGRLDNPTLPNEGYKLNLLQELSGFNSTSKFLKTKIDLLLAKRLTNSISINLNGQSGLLLSLDNKPSLLPDRFNLGGPTSIRGFRTWGLGQHDKGSSLGGDLYWSTGVSIFGKLPLLNFENLKWHTFFNIGKLVKFNQESSNISQLKENLISGSLYKQNTSSAGVGLVYQLQNVRLEANYTLPLTINSRDQVRKGFQLGLGIEFL